MLDFGSLDEHSADELVRRANADVVVSGIAHLGPMSLLRFASSRSGGSFGFPAFSAVCEACEYLVNSSEAIGIIRRHSDDVWSRIKTASLTRRGDGQ